MGLREVRQVTLTNWLIEPNTCHPDFEYHREFLMDWLNSKGSLAERHTVEIAFPTAPAAFWLANDTYPPEPYNRAVLDKHRFAGLAPWTDIPYFYGWYGAVDSKGRTVAGDAWREPDAHWRYRRGTCAF